MGDKRDEGGQGKFSTLGSYLPESLRNKIANANERTSVRNKVLAAVVATGAFAAVGAPLVATASDSDNGSNSGNVAQVAQQRPMSDGGNGTKDAPGSVQLRGDKAKQAPNKSEEGDKAANAEKDEQRETKAEREKKQQQAVAEQAERKKERAQKAAKAKAEKKAEAKKEKAEKPVAAAKAKAAPAPKAEKLVEEGFLTSGYHTRGGSHAGIDVGADTGTPIYTPEGGRVISSGPASGFGQWVRVQHDGGKVTVYGHIHSSKVSVGQRVEAGEEIATVGSRGQSTGPHLHFEVRQGPGAAEQNPIPWLKDRGVALG